MREVNINTLESVTEDVILGHLAARRIPETRERWFEDAGSRANDVEGAKLFFSGLEEAVQIVPGCDICFVEDGFRAVGLVAILFDELLCLWPQTKIAEEDVATIL